MGLDLLGDTVGKLGRPAELALVNVSCWVTCAYRHASLELLQQYKITLNTKRRYLRGREGAALYA